MPTDNPCQTARLVAQMAAKSDAWKETSDEDFAPATMASDEVYIGTRKYVAEDRIQTLTGAARDTALADATRVVACVAAPVVGTPYAVGGRLFAEAIDALRKDQPTTVIRRVEGDASPVSAEEALRQKISLLYKFGSQDERGAGWNAALDAVVAAFGAKPAG